MTCFEVSSVSRHTRSESALHDFKALEMSSMHYNTVAKCTTCVSSHANRVITRSTRTVEMHTSRHVPHCIARLAVGRAERHNGLLRLATPGRVRSTGKGRARVVAVSASTAASGVEPLSTRPLVLLQDTAIPPEEAIKQVQDVPGIYAVYDDNETL
eukprot:6172079-Pyramimonas_sp.AAC.3